MTSTDPTLSNFLSNLDNVTPEEAADIRAALEITASSQSPTFVSGVAIEWGASEDATIANLGAAHAIETKTADFTAVKGGRYITEGTVIVSDPTGTAVGDSYEVWIGSGTATIGGTAYSPSRFSIRRRVSSIGPVVWSTPTPQLTDALSFSNTTAKDNTLANLGGGTAGIPIFKATTYTGAGSTRKLQGLDTTDSPTFTGISAGRFDNGSGGAYISWSATDRIIWYNGSNVAKMYFRPASGLVLSSDIPILFRNATSVESGTNDVGIYRNGSGIVEINNATAGQFRDLKVRNILSNSVTVANLAGAVEGARSFVTDSTVAAAGNFGAIVAGGGTDNVPVFYDGTNWRIG